VLSNSGQTAEGSICKIKKLKIEFQEKGGRAENLPQVPLHPAPSSKAGQQAVPPHLFQPTSSQGWRGMDNKSGT
jgi:hypothetical protein